MHDANNLDSLTTDLIVQIRRRKYIRNDRLWLSVDVWIIYIFYY